MQGATILIERNRTSWLLFRNIGIWLDDERKGRIGRMTTLEIHVSPGDYILQARLDWNRSPQYPITVAEGAFLHYVVLGMRTPRFMLPDGSPLPSINPWA